MFFGLILVYIGAFPVYFGVFRCISVYLDVFRCISVFSYILYKVGCSLFWLNSGVFQVYFDVFRCIMVYF